MDVHVKSQCPTYCIFGHIAKNVFLQLFCYIASTNGPFGIKFAMKVLWDGVQVHGYFHTLICIGLGIIAK